MCRRHQCLFANANYISRQLQTSTFLFLSPQGNEASYPLEMCSHCKYFLVLLLLISEFQFSKFQNASQLDNYYA